MKKITVLLLALLSVIQLGVVPVAQAENMSHDSAQVRSSHHRHNNRGLETIYWGQSKFYRDPQTQRITADFYTQQTIDDLASLMAHLRYSRIAFDSAPGAIPLQLREYAYHKLAQYGIAVTNYAPGLGTIISWNQSTFYENGYGQIFATNYSHQTIDDLAHLLASRGFTRINLIPQGQLGAIPNHLRAYAISRFNAYGISVVSSGGQYKQPQQQHPHKKPKNQNHKNNKPRKRKNNDVFLDLFIEIMKNR